MDAKDLIGQGIMAAKRGQNEKARELFNLALITEPRNENAWLWLGTVAVDDAEKEDCLRQVLAINPGNLSAASELQKLGEKRRGVLTAQLAALAAAQTAVDTTPVEAASAPVLAASAGAAARRRGGRAQLPPVAKYAIIGGFGLLILIILFGSVNLVNRILNPITPTITLTPSRTSTIPPTWTLTATWTPTVCPLRVCTATPTITPSITPTFTETPVPSLTPSRTSTVTRTANTNTSTHPPRPAQRRARQPRHSPQPPRGRPRLR